LQMRRREFIARLGAAGAYATVPRLAFAQQDTRVRRVAILQQLSDIQLVTSINATFRNELAKLGWVEGRNLQIDLRFGQGDVDRMRANATELVALAPDVIVAGGPTMTAIVQRQTQTIPIVFEANDGLARGLVKDLAHPEGNTTGVNFVYQSMAGKWVELLKEAVPRLQHVGYFYSTRLDPQLQDYFPQVGEASRLLGVRAERIPFGNVADIARGFDAFAAEPDGGLVMSGFGEVQATVAALAFRYRIPTVCRDRTIGDCLIVYQPRWDELAIRTASFVDRILRGAKPGDLPVEYPTKFDLFVNLKTAKAIGVTIPEAFLARAEPTQTFWYHRPRRNRHPTRANATRN
jgi:putative tryptophan/tyrosine transport system substrate-binding protein